MPGEANVIQNKINKLVEQLKTEKDPAEIARLEAAIKSLKDDLKELVGR